MSRDAFGQWGGPVSEEDFAAAVAAIGVAAAIDPAIFAEATPETRWAALEIGESPRIPLGWRSPLETVGWDRVPAATWSRLWKERNTRGYDRIAVEPELGTLDFGWLVSVLGGPGALANGIHLALPGEPAAPAWRFPLRVGVLDRLGGIEIRGGLEQAAEPWVRTLVRPVRIGVEGVACDLLVLRSDAAVARTVLADLREVRAGAVLLIDGARHLDLSLLEVAGADVVGLADASDAARFVVWLARELTHDNPLDVALSRVSDRRGLLAGPTRFFTAQTLSRRALTVAAELRAVDEAKRTRGGPYEATALAADLEDVAAHGAFVSEEGDASTIVEMERRAGPLVEGAAAQRHLQARIALSGAPDRPLAAFVAGATHHIDVKIDLPDADWVTASAPFPEDRLPTDRPSRLTVVLTEPHLLDAPLVDEIVLPPTGPSTTCSFRLTTESTTEAVDARLIVLSRNRVLQTARLPRMVDRGEATPSGSREAAAETVVNPETLVAGIGQGLDDRRTFDAAFVVNDGDDGVSRVTAVAGTEAAVVSFDGTTVLEALAKITARLGEIVESPDDFGDLEAPGTRELLVFLAHHGRVMRNALVKYFLGDVLGSARFLQVVPARPETFFPFEFAYDFAAPREDAALCPDAAAALLDPDPASGCPGTHDASTVCPFGFWAISKVIERHAFKPGGTPPAGFLLRSRPTRDRERIELTPATLLAASDRVDAVAAGSVDSVVAAVEAVAGSTDRVMTWQEWEQGVAKGDSSLLLLLPHTVHSDTLDSFGLEIGAGERVWVGDIDERFVPPLDRPVVLVLLGCETAAAGRVGYERFPSLFALAGAEIVIATLTEVLGRHAAPVASRLAEMIHRCCADGPRSIGEVMVALRRRLLAEGVPMVLAVAVFGDADWVLAEGVA